MNEEIIILSPHLDDAILSLGEHIIQWKSEQKKVTIINIFSSFKTTVLPNYTKEYLKKSGCDVDWKEFEKKRKNEDKKALMQLGVPSINLDFVDGGFRTFQGKSVYETSHKLFSGNISKKDEKLTKQLMLKLASHISKNSVVYVPYAIGKHADHILTRIVGKRLSKTTYYYADMPYAFNRRNWSVKHLFFFIKNLKSFKISTMAKKKSLTCYHSQMKVLFKNYPVLFPEISAKKIYEF